MDLGLRGKVAMVGGASRGLGFACAAELAREGVRVSLCSRKQDEAEAAAGRIAADSGGEVAGFGFDLASAQAPAAWVEATRKRFGAIDILVHNTGGPPPGDFDDHDDGAWQQAFELVVLSAVRLFRAVIPDMKKKGWGRIVAIESISVKEPIDGLLLSNATRPAVVAIGKALSRDLAARNIVVNCVAPGYHNTDRTRQLAVSRAAREGITPEEYNARHIASFPRGRSGEPEELAAAVVFLCSERASNITGVTLVADGGISRSLY